MFAGRASQASNEPGRDSSITTTESYVAHLLTALSTASALCSLKILVATDPATHADPTGALIVEVLCAHLEDTPHPALEHLALALVSCDTATPFSPTLCARFANAILGPKRTSDGRGQAVRPCACFRRLTVTLNVQAGAAAAVGPWLLVGPVPEKEAWLKRWEESFGRFLEEGVVVNITA